MSADGFAKCAVCGVVVFRDELDGGREGSVVLRPEGPSCYDCRAAFLYSLIEPVTEAKWERIRNEPGETATIVLIGQWDDLSEPDESRN